MAQAKGVRPVGYIDVVGGGQIVVDGNYAYVAHINGTTGTTIIDVSDPKNPRQVANIPTNSGIHAHKVRVEKQGYRPPAADVQRFQMALEAELSRMGM